MLFSPHEEFVRYTLEAVQNFRRILKLLELQASDFLVSRVVICQCLSNISSGSFSLYDQNFNSRNNKIHKNDNEVGLFSFFDCKSLRFLLAVYEMQSCNVQGDLTSYISRQYLEFKGGFSDLPNWNQWDMSIISKLDRK